MTLNFADSVDPVPFIVTGEKGLIKTDVTDGALADVAPTILAIMGLPQPDGALADQLQITDTPQR